MTLEDRLLRRREAMTQLSMRDGLTTEWMVIINSWISRVSRENETEEEERKRGKSKNKKKWLVN